MAKKDAASPDKYDLFIQKIDHFQSLVKQKKNLQEKIAIMQQEFQEKIRPFEEELSAILKKLDLNPPQNRRERTRKNRFFQIWPETAWNIHKRSSPLKSFPHVQTEGHCRCAEHQKHNRKPVAEQIRHD